MRIVYGVAGEGYGHSSRALTVIPFLQKLGHEVIVLTYKNAYDALKDKFKVIKIHGIGLVFADKKLSQSGTVAYNIKNLPKNFFKYKEFQWILDKFNPDLFITDYEPISYLLSIAAAKPVISIGNHQAMEFYDVDVPLEYKKDYYMVLGITKGLTPKADYFIISFFEKLKTGNKTMITVPPIVRDDVRKLKPNKKDKILVYLNNAEHVLKVLEKIKGEKFIVYGLDKKEKYGNIELKTRESFLKDLEESKAIIATAGFSLMSEALYLRKPLLAIPLEGQFEQMFNALYLKKSGMGDYCEQVSEEKVNEFLANLKNYENKLKKYKPKFGDLYKTLERILNEISRRKSFTQKVGEKFEEVRNYLR